MNIASAQTVGFVAFLGLFFPDFPTRGSVQEKRIAIGTETEPGTAQRDVCGLIQGDEMAAIIE